DARGAGSRGTRLSVQGGGGARSSGGGRIAADSQTLFRFQGNRDDAGGASKRPEGQAQRLAPGGGTDSARAPNPAVAPGGPHQQGSTRSPGNKPQDRGDASHQPDAQARHSFDRRTGALCPAQ